jgi:uncharacterized membrane protein YfcA
MSETLCAEANAMNLHAATLVATAGLLCGALNAVAGGGSLILFPALVATGLPTLAANVTNSVATWPGYVGGVAGFWDDLRDQKHRLWPLALATLAGSTTGCVLLLTTPTSAFDKVVPVLVLFASALLAVQPYVKRWVGKARNAAGVRWFAIFLATIYGGYFGGALGVIMVGVLSLTLADSLRRLNALKGGLSLVDASVSVVIFGLFGPVDWMSVLVAAPSTLVGGYVGARLARRLPDRLLRWCVVVFGIGVAAWLAFR